MTIEPEQSKNIVVLSDGTGNGAAKAQKTNVWRLYRALDLHDPGQIAFYDDGVGSRDGWFSKVLGGAFGFGLKHNVLEMYKFLCRNYRPAGDDREADRIYLFGFSRGAFTVRVLASFIQMAGLIDARGLGKGELDRLARANYSHYRRQYQGGWLYRILVGIFFRKLDCRKDYIPDIEFLGVWDTVDAYALPMDELAMIWHKLVYPIRFTNFDLSGCVKKARHAISLDDERHTFHPLLWNEPDPPTADLEQVWFAGVHTNVGGGYPDDSLALVTLDWMMGECESNNQSPSQGLVFIGVLRQQYHDQSDWNGPIYNSRSGLAVFFRYRPRHIEHLYARPDVDLKLQKPIIHRSVFERICSQSYPYAPTGIPGDYDLTGMGRHKNYEEAADIEPRVKRLQAAKNVIFARRGLYIAFLLISLSLVASRFFLEWDAQLECAGAICAVAPLLQWLPDMLDPWTRALLQNGAWLTLFVIAYAGMFWLARTLRAKTLTLAGRAWTKLNGMSPGAEFEPGGFTAFRQLWDRKIGYRLRQALALFISLVMLYLLAWMVSKATFHYRSTTGKICEATEMALTPLGIGASLTSILSVADGCRPTRIYLEKGVMYRFEPTSTEIFDGAHCTTTVDGLTEPSAVQQIFAPFKRHFDQPYMKLMGRIGSKGDESFSIDARGIDYTPKSSARLYLYVNDAVVGYLPNWDYFYYSSKGQNRGRVDVQVSRAPAVPLPNQNVVIETRRCNHE